jgi:ribose transport system ATP-binding protein
VIGAGDWRSGAIEVGGEVVTRPTPRGLKRRGVVLLPADRLRDSGVAGASLRENVSLPALGGYFRRGRIDHRGETRDVRGLLERFQVRPPSPHALLGTLSGGNQQKALLAKWLQLQPRVLVLHEPTQGVDVGSRRDVFLHIRQVAEAGAGVVVVSSEPEDLAQLCDRVLILHEGVVAGSLVGRDITEDSIVRRTYAVSSGGNGETR